MKISHPMKKHFTISVYLGLFAILVGACKKNEQSGPAPSCLLTQIKLSRDTLMSDFSYNTSGKITSMNLYLGASKFYARYSYAGNIDTVYSGGQDGGSCHVYTIGSNGYASFSVIFIDVPLIDTTKYIYNAAGYLIKSTETIEYPSIDTTKTYTTTTYTYENGNLMSSTTIS